MLLTTVGHEVHTEHSGQAALQAVRTFQPEVVLLDIGLPDMDGYEVARRLREQGLPSEVRLIALSGYGQEQGARDQEKTPFDHYLLKPVSLDDLQALLSASPSS
jgi:CheY-like chemotaxis protein